MRARVAFVSSLVGVTLLASCSSGQPLSTQASNQLEAQVQAVRASASAHDPARASTQLTQLRAQVNALAHQGQISRTRATEILAAADAVQAQLASIPVPPPPTTTTTAVPRPAPAPPAHDQHRGDGGDKGGGGGGDGGH